MHLVGCTIEIYYDAQTYERQTDHINCFSPNMHRMIKRRKYVGHVASMDIRNACKICIGKCKGAKPNSATYLERVVNWCDVRPAVVTCAARL